MRSDDGVTLLVALSRERHREREDYAMAVRLPDGLLLAIRCYTGWDRNKPSRFPDLPGPPPFLSYLVDLDGSSHFAHVDASDFQHPGVLELSSIEVFERHGCRSIWLCHVNTKEDEKRIHDSRGGKTVSTKATLSTTERDLALCPIPAFGEYSVLAEWVRALLQCLGYGEVA